MKITYDKLPDGLKKPITNVQEAKKWIDLLVASNMSWHFEDSAIDIGHSEDGKWVNSWSTTVGRLLNKRRDELYSLPFSVWGKDGCPIGYMLTKEKH